MDYEPLTIDFLEFLNLHHLSGANTAVPLKYQLKRGNKQNGKYNIT